MKLAKTLILPNTLSKINIVKLCCFISFLISGLASRKIQQ